MFFFVETIGGGTMAASQVTRSFAKYHGTWCLELNKLFDQKKVDAKLCISYIRICIYIYLLPRNFGHIYLEPN